MVRLLNKRSGVALFGLLHRLVRQKVPNVVINRTEMAQRIGSSRETVTRLLSDLKRKQLIRLDGATLVIKNRTALEALAV